MTYAFPVLHTERLILRPFEQRDAQAYFEILSDEKTNTFLPMFPLKTPDEARERLENIVLPDYKKRDGFRWAICLKTDDRPIGYVALSSNRSHDLGYALREPFWRRGIVTEAAAAAVGAIKNAGFGYITATHDVNNPRSGAVMRKIGMEYKYSYVEQWQPKNFAVTFRMYQLNFLPDAETFMEYWNMYEQHFVEEGI